MSATAIATARMITVPSTVAITAATYDDRSAPSAALPSSRYAPRKNARELRRRRDHLAHDREAKRRRDRTVGHRLEEALRVERRRARSSPESREHRRAGTLPRDHGDDAGSRRLVRAARTLRIAAERAHD